jgi:heptaprenyl diphosphate synthase
LNSTKIIGAKILYQFANNNSCMTQESKAEKVLLLLNKKSERALAVFQQLANENNFGKGNIDKAIELYLSRWKDSTRPGVLAIASEAVGGKLEDIVSLQVALLFIDVTMDVHDDIIDGSLSKKNIKTLYGKLGPEVALLVGDEYMTRSFYYLHQCTSKLPNNRQDLIMKIMNSFLAEIVDAHISEVQLKKERWSVKPGTYLHILTKKAAEIEGRMKIGAIYSGGSAEEIEAIGVFGRNLGILLAIRAEFTDLFEPAELSDRIKKGSLPLQLLYALQNKNYSPQIRALLSKDKISANDSRELLQLIQETKTMPLLMEYLKCIKNEAIQALHKLKSEKERRSLELVIASMLEDL